MGRRRFGDKINGLSEKKESLSSISHRSRQASPLEGRRERERERERGHKSKRGDGKSDLKEG